MTAPFVHEVNLFTDTTYVFIFVLNLISASVGRLNQPTSLELSVPRLNWPSFTSAIIHHQSNLIILVRPIYSGIIRRNEGLVFFLTFTQIEINLTYPVYGLKAE